MGLDEDGPSKRRLAITWAWKRDGFAAAALELALVALVATVGLAYVAIQTHSEIALVALGLIATSAIGGLLVLAGIRSSRAGRDDEGR